MSPTLVGLVGVDGMSIGWRCLEWLVVSHQILEMFSLGLCINDRNHTKELRRNFLSGRKWAKYLKVKGYFLWNAVLKTLWKLFYLLIYFLLTDSDIWICTLRSHYLRIFSSLNLYTKLFLINAQLALHCFWIVSRNSIASAPADARTVKRIVRLFPFCLFIVFLPHSDIIFLFVIEPQFIWLY